MNKVQGLIKLNKMNEDYIKLLLKRIRQRQDIYEMLVSKIEVSNVLIIEIESLKEQINELDRRITVLTP